VVADDTGERHDRTRPLVGHGVLVGGDRQRLVDHAGDDRAAHVGDGTRRRPRT
jgi:hypothetical protein